MIWFVTGIFVGLFSAAAGLSAGMWLRRQEIAEIEAQELQAALEEQVIRNRRARAQQSEQLRAQLLKAHMDTVARPLHLGPVHGKWGRA